MKKNKIWALGSSAAAISLVLALNGSWAQNANGTLDVSGFELSIIDPVIAAFYTQNSSEIADLAETARLADDTKDRISALAKLAETYPLASEALARELVNDPATEVALFSVRTLQGSIVMMDHGPMGDLSDFPELAAAMQSHALSIAALRPAIQDERTEVRTEAASILSSLGDDDALALINEGANKGMIPAVEAANYYTLAGTPAANGYLAEYLGSEDVSVQQTAVGYLAALPKYQSQIRESYFLNPSADPSVRLAASQSLGIYDPEFPVYALTVLGQDVAPIFAVTTIQGYVASVEQRGLLTPEIAQNVGDALADYEFNAEGLATFRALSDRLNAIAE